MMNPVLILTRNNLELTKKAVESVYNQRLSNVWPFIVDNGSSDGTLQWAVDNGILLTAFVQRRREHRMESRIEHFV